MTSRCNICLDPACETRNGGEKKCNCDTCSNRDNCPRYAGLKPTIRITRKCTQACSHCCFECDTNCGEMMSVVKAREISRFCQANDITVCEIMGGEFFLNPDWAEIVPILATGMKQVRLISNGDWAASTPLATKITETLSDLPQIHVGISKDQWHTNAHVDQACAYLKDADIPFQTPEPEEVTEATIVPVGRAEGNCFNIYSMFGAYCHKESKKYNFLIDEDGRIYKCGFGIWNYAEVEEYLDGGFDERFKECNMKFYGVFVSSCTACQKMSARAKAEEKSCCNTA